MVNGQPSWYFASSRGLQQGGHLPPHLFALCSEGFTALIRKAILSRELHGVCLNHRCPLVSHLIFVYDSYLFLRASVRNGNNLLRLLHDYESMSGQKVNLQKSTAYFSSNLTQVEQEDLGTRLGAGSIGLQDRYFGLPSWIGHSKTGTFRFVEEKLLMV
ncbi:unnamed protein product [Linum trigynum]|uniref:Reverse transcriptase domain-containing protein n=1 Tax=Linum trigynum TaxID=586398 RepID=A0AAV2EE75_9ROSI